jgi:hypothetical protein
MSLPLATLTFLSLAAAVEVETSAAVAERVVTLKSLTHIFQLEA